jgi:hypothetical protein
MKFEIADWRFEITLNGLLCQPIERGPAKAAKKPAGRRVPVKGASGSEPDVIELAVKTQNLVYLHSDKQAQQKGATK